MSHMKGILKALETAFELNLFSTTANKATSITSMQNLWNFFLVRVRDIAEKKEISEFLDFFIVHQCSKTPWNPS